jgi:hypothetical protein
MLTGFSEREWPVHPCCCFHSGWLMNRSCIAIRIRLLQVYWTCHVYGPGFGDRGRALRLEQYIFWISCQCQSVYPSWRTWTSRFSSITVITTPTINRENPEEADEKCEDFLWSYQLSDGWVLPRTTVPVLCGLKGYWKACLVMSIVGMSMRLIVWVDMKCIWWHPRDMCQGNCLYLCKVSYLLVWMLEVFGLELLHDVCISTCVPKAERTIYRYSSFL